MIYNEHGSPKEFSKRPWNKPLPLGQAPVNRVYFDLSNFAEGEHRMGFNLYFDNISTPEIANGYKNLNHWYYITSKWRSTKMTDTTEKFGTLVSQPTVTDTNTMEEYKSSGITITPDVKHRRPESTTAATFESVDYDIDNLPMAINLRGDEDFFEQFDLDANTVMERLNIKRSRLNQISGKELRVGRAKVDRYIRPIYRSIDVENYLSWSRATATNKKNTDVITDATQQLSEIAETLQKSLSKDSGVLTNSLNVKLQKLGKIIGEHSAK